MTRLLLPGAPRLAAPTVVLFLSAILAAGAASPAAAQLSQTHTLDADAVSIRNLVGDVRVVRASGSRIEVSVVRAGPDADELEVETRREGDRDVVRVLYPDNRIVYRPFGRTSRSEWSTTDTGAYRDLVPRGSRNITISGSGRGVEAHAEITVRLPPGKRLEIQNAAGRVELEDVDGELDVQVRSASVDARLLRGPLTIEGRSGAVGVQGVHGDVRVRTRSGSIRAEGIRAELLELDARSGSIEASDLTFGRADLSARSGRIRVADAQGGRLSIETRSGRIQGGGVEAGEVRLTSRSGGADIRGLATGVLRAESRSGAVELELVRQLASGTIQTRSGRVALQVPRGFEAELVLESRGRIQVDASASAVEQSRDRFRGRLGDGGAPVHVRARSGTIRIREG